MKSIDVFDSPRFRGLNQGVYERLSMIQAQREEVMEAFIAKYGFEPERFVQVEQRDISGSFSWYVRRRSDEEMLRLSQEGAQL